MSAADEEIKAQSAPQRAAPLDARRNVFRPDLAAESLYGRVSAPRYVQGYPAQVIRAAVPLRSRPSPTVGFETEALFGETVTVYDEREGWAWVQLTRDRYVGYVPFDALSPEIDEPTHRVRALGTFVYPVPDIKSPPLMHLSMNAELCIAGGDERFLMLKGGGFVVTRHVAERGRRAPDFVELAERFIGTPYLWGGRTRLGIDCSGLVQVTLEAAGIAAPRDTDMQQAELGTEVAIPDVLEGMQRGDLIYWKGHVGIMADSVTLVHANAHHMQVAAETLPEAIERIAKLGAEIAAVKRLPALSGKDIV
ncbi:MAG: C40 family peptidase [Hyphomicrobium sp.]|uniref:C40 family peptidase n=1 Tax=Hyphomicrobium sp. TaxID=82 RepID=UPI0013219092|nr:NlpC/P60 family protein [Hyphomicrobium sp.]KAB2941780.1 MAG: NlpC/P60 family protein [Hyphomicrobium sp.]MBZ0210049.1 C40 family peptidase [Hyphomicrobium sp.]MCZ7596446.1 NlpC/P60 family protein [Hyphomicrobium sp.]